VFNFELTADAHPCHWVARAWRDLLGHGVNAERLSVATTAVQALCMSEEEATLYKTLCNVICGFYLGFPDARLSSTVGAMRLAYYHSMPQIKETLSTLLLVNQRGFGCGIRFQSSVLRELIYRHILPALLADCGAAAEQRIAAVCNTARYLDRFWVPNAEITGVNLAIQVCGKSIDLRRHARVRQVPSILLSHAQSVLEAAVTSD
jgi:hypothetical protein